MTWQLFLKEYQPAIVGVVGFTGIILTLFVNAYISRKRASEAIEHERRILMRSLRAELQSHRKWLESAMNEDDAGYFLLPPIITPIYQANLSRLGLLPEDRIDHVIHGYAVLFHANNAIELMAISTDKLSIRRVEIDNFVRLKRLKQMIMPIIDLAIYQLSKK